MYDQYKVCKCFKVPGFLILPAFFEEFIEGVPVLKLQDCFELQLDNLEVFCYHVISHVFLETLGSQLFSSNFPETLAIFPSMEIVLKLAALVLAEGMWRKVELSRNHGCCLRHELEWWKHKQGEKYRSSSEM